MPCFLKYYLLVVVNDECSCTMTTSHSLDFFITCTRCYKLYHFDCLGHDSLMLPFSNSSRVLAKVLSLDRHSCAVFPSGLHSVDAVSLLAEQPKWRFHPLLGLSTPEQQLLLGMNMGQSFNLQALRAPMLDVEIMGTGVHIKYLMKLYINTCCLICLNTL